MNGSLSDYNAAIPWQFRPEITVFAAALFTASKLETEAVRYLERRLDTRVEQFENQRRLFLSHCELLRSLAERAQPFRIIYDTRRATFCIGTRANNSLCYGPRIVCRLEIPSAQFTVIDVAAPSDFARMRLPITQLPSIRSFYTGYRFLFANCLLPADPAIRDAPHFLGTRNF